MPSTRIVAMIAAVVLGVLALLAPVGPATAASKADVKVTLRADETDGVSGRVRSDRAACFKQVGVGLIGKRRGKIVEGGTTVTDNQGRYPTQQARTRARAAATTRFITIVPGSAKCEVAQSNSVDMEVMAKRADVSVTLNATPNSFRGSVRSQRPPRPTARAGTTTA